MSDDAIWMLAGWEGKAGQSKGVQLLDLDPVAGSRDAIRQPGSALLEKIAGGIGDGHLLVADLPAARLIQALRRRGHGVERLGHRVFDGEGFGRRPDWANGRTLKEQLVERGLDTLTDDQRIDEAWRRDGWAGLSALGVGWEKADKHARQLENWLEGSVARKERALELDDLTLLLAPMSCRGVAADALQMLRMSKAPDAITQLGSACRSDDDATLVEQRLDAWSYHECSARRLPVNLPEVLVLFHGDGEDSRGALSRLQELELRTGTSRLPWLLSLLRDNGIRTEFELMLELGCYGCRLQVRARNTVAAPLWDALVDRLLGVTLVTGRPLLDYNATFYLPLDLHVEKDIHQSLGEEVFRSQEGLGDGEQDTSTGSPRQRSVDLLWKEIQSIRNEPDAEAAKRKLREQLQGQFNDEVAEAQALLYFDPKIADKLNWSFGVGAGTQTGCDPEAATGERFLEWGEQSAITDDLYERLFPSEHRRATLSRTHLRPDENGLAVLVLNVRMPEVLRSKARQFRRDGADWWHPLLLAKDDEDRNGIRGLQVEHWLRATRVLRQLRPAFPGQLAESKLPKLALISKSVNGETNDALFDGHQMFSPVLLHLINRCLQRKLTDDDPRLDQIADDRMVVNVAYPLAGPLPGGDDARGEFRRLFSLAMYVDRGADTFAAANGHAYDPDFIHQLSEAWVYRRWESVGSLYGFTNYSNVALGFGQFFADVVTRIHMPRIYGRMLLKALFYELTLNWFERRVASMSMQLIERDDRNMEAFRRLHADFMEFTNVHWFPQLTRQVQGQEIFDLQVRALRLQERYELVKDELERADEFVAEVRGRRVSEIANRIGIIGLVLAVAAVPIAVLQIVPETEPSTFHFLVAVALAEGILLYLLKQMVSEKVKQRKRGEKS